MYDEMPDAARIEITTKGGWPKETSTSVYPVIPALAPEHEKDAPAPGELTESLKRPFAVLSAMSKLLAGQPGAEYERAFVAEAMKACEACRARATMDAGPGYFRAITPARKTAIVTFYEQTALRMFNGFAKRMAVYAEKGDARQKRLAALFTEAQRP